MPRSVNAVASRARRKKVLKLAKGNFGSRGNVWTVAKNTVEKGLTYAYRDRKNKKRQFRSLWIQRINAAVRGQGMTYSEFMGKMNAKGIRLNRKVLADLAMNNAAAFEKIVKTVKSLFLRASRTNQLNKKCRKQFRHFFVGYYLLHSVIMLILV